MAYKRLGYYMDNQQKENNSNSNNINNNNNNNNSMNNNSMNNNSSSMGNVFDSFKEYGGKWECIDVRYFNDKELSNIKSVIIKASDYGKSACFTMINGRKKYIPVDKNSTLNLGDNPDPSKLQLKAIKNNGEPSMSKEAIIYRVDLEPEIDNEEVTDFDNPFGV